MPSVATDQDRIASAHTPLGRKLLFRELRGREELSRTFQYDVELLAENDSGVDPKALLGRNITIAVRIQGGGTRYIDGQCARFSYIGSEVQGQRNTILYRYLAVLRPWTWYMTLASNCRIFQEKSVPDIIRDLLAPYPFPTDFRLTRSYRTWEYCVQYQETDFNFMSRLLEHEGIYYFFEHAMGNHTLVFADDIGAHASLPGYSSIPHIQSDTMLRPDEDWIDHWHMSQEVDSGVHITDDYDFKNPSGKLEVVKRNSLPHPWGDQEIYEWPGGYWKVSDGEQYSRSRLEEAQQPQETTSAHSNVRGLMPGYLFTLTRCPRRDQNREYLLLSVEAVIRDNPYTAGAAPPAEWRFVLTAQPSNLAYRPSRRTPKPLTTGPQTAIVVGPRDEEIYTDEHGRVKVQFHWDRYGKADQNSSCWIRVSSTWAGSNWGQISLPRIGQEVIVDFLNGDPDYPVIVGRLYNAEHKPPYALPQWKEYSTIKSRSTKKGGNNDWNEIRFYDYKGKEQIFIHCNWRYDLRVKWKSYVTIRESSHYQIGHGYYISIGGKYQVIVGSDFGMRVEGKHQVSAGGVFQTIAESDYQLSSDSKIELNAPSIVVEASNALTLKVGANIVKLDLSGITIQGMLVRINSGGGAGPATPFEFEDPDGAEEADDGTPGFLDRPRKKGSGTKKKRKGGQHRAPISGLGPEIDGIAGRSPKLASNLAQLQKDGWTIKYGEPGKGTFADRTTKEIVVDPNEKADASGVVQSLAHESGHALYTMDPYVPPDGLTKDDYVKKNTNRNLKDEGEATMTNAEVRNEILGTDGGPDIGIAGSQADKYDEIAKKYPNPEDRDKARQEIGDAFADGEQPSGDQNAGKTYRQYYGEPYEKHYDKVNAGK